MSPPAHTLADLLAYLRRIARKQASESATISRKWREYQHPMQAATRAAAAEMSARKFTAWADQLQTLLGVPQETA